VIAYRQPIGRAEVEEIRGVSVGGVLKTLLERGLVDVIGRSEGLGRPLTVRHDPLFLEQFALRHVASCRAPTSSRWRCAPTPKPE
jgi:segregation and condensation protein B